MVRRDSLGKTEEIYGSVLKCLGHGSVGKSVGERERGEGERGESVRGPALPCPYVRPTQTERGLAIGIHPSLQAAPVDAHSGRQAS